MRKLTPSTFQKEIFEFVKTGTGNAVINAVAGSGKTTTIISSLRFIPTDKSVIFLAFNKSIVQEIQQKVPTNVVVKTFHSLGASSIFKSYRDKSKLDENKIYDFINNAAPKLSFLDKTTIDNDYKNRIKKIVDLANYFAELRSSYIGNLGSDDYKEVAIQKEGEVNLTSINLSLLEKAQESANSAIVVPNDFVKSELLDKLQNKHRVFTISEIKGLEYSNIICYNLWRCILEDHTR